MCRTHFTGSRPRIEVAGRGRCHAGYRCAWRWCQREVALITVPEIGRSVDWRRVRAGMSPFKRGPGNWASARQIKRAAECALRPPGKNDCLMKFPCPGNSDSTEIGEVTEGMWLVGSYRMQRPRHRAALFEGNSWQLRRPTGDIQFPEHQQESGIAYRHHCADQIAGVAFHCPPQSDIAQQNADPGD